MHPRFRLLAGWCLAAALAASCSPAAGANRAKPPFSPQPTRTPAATTAAVDPASVHANELGMVPVLMFHMLLPRPKGNYDITPAAFVSMLGRLYREGYRPITAAELAAGRVDTPAGTHPVVLTFDDATRSQFALAGDTVAPGTAVALLQAFARTSPGFRPVATFYVNRDPFGYADAARPLGWLHRNGFDIGDHTFDHVPLSRLDDTGVQKELVLGQRVIADALPGTTVTTMALPLGLHPKNRALSVRGSYSGTTYEFGAVMQVGAGPAPSPYSVDYDPGGVPRMRASLWRPGSPVDYSGGYWLDWLARHPTKRYISDGNPDTVSFPRALAPRVAPAFAAAARPY